MGNYLKKSKIKLTKNTTHLFTTNEKIRFIHYQFLHQVYDKTPDAYKYPYIRYFNGWR